MRTSAILVAMLAALMLLATQAVVGMTLTATLDGLQEVPPNASPGSGFGTVLLNAAEDQITADLSWVDLLAPATAGHIHGPAAPGFPAGVIFPLTGVSGTSGSIVTQTFAITAGQVTWLKDGLLYFNIHTQPYPGGEIRGQIVPEPASLAMLGLALSAGIAVVRRKKVDG